MLLLVLRLKAETPPGRCQLPAAIRNIALSETLPSSPPRFLWRYLSTFNRQQWKREQDVVLSCLFDAGLSCSVPGKTAASSSHQTDFRVALFCIHLLHLLSSFRHPPSALQARGCKKQQFANVIPTLQSPAVCRVSVARRGKEPGSLCSAAVSECSRAAASSPLCGFEQDMAFLNVAQGLKREESRLDLTPRLAGNSACHNIWLQKAGFICVGIIGDGPHCHAV